MNTDIRNPHTQQDIDKLEATIANLRHEAYAYKRQRDALRSALQKAYVELNAIRARDGVPYRRDGFKSDVDPEYFSSVVDEACEVIAATKP